MDSLLMFGDQPNRESIVCFFSDRSIDRYLNAWTGVTEWLAVQMQFRDSPFLALHHSNLATRPACISAPKSWSWLNYKLVIESKSLHFPKGKFGHWCVTALVVSWHYMYLNARLNPPVSTRHCILYIWSCRPLALGILGTIVEVNILKIAHCRALERIVLIKFQLN